MNKVLEKNFKKHCKIVLLSYLSKIDCKNAKNQQILGFVCRRRRKKAILKLLLRELKNQVNVEAETLCVRCVIGLTKRQQIFLRP